MTKQEYDDHTRAFDLLNKSVGQPTVGELAQLIADVRREERERAARTVQEHYVCCNGPSLAEIIRSGE